MTTSNPHVSRSRLPRLRMFTLPVACALCLAVLGCGGPSSPSSPTSLLQQSLLSFTSQPGDWIGNGQAYRYTSDNATFRTLNYPLDRRMMQIQVLSNDRRSLWIVTLGAPAGQELRVGSYENADWTGAAGTRPRFSLVGEGRGCASEGRFVIQNLTFRETVDVAGRTVPLLVRLHVLFAQRCTDTSAPGLTGELSFVETP